VHLSIQLPTLLSDRVRLYSGRVQLIKPSSFWRLGCTICILAACPCSWTQKGYCALGDSCGYAHSHSELRTPAQNIADKVRGNNA